MPDTALKRPSVWISLDLPDGTIAAVPGGPTDHHITVVYLGRISDEAYDTACTRAQVAAMWVAGPLVGTVAGVDSFEPSAGSGGKTPAFAPVVLPGVEALRVSLDDLSASEHQAYRPHVTLAYLDEGDRLPASVPPTRVTFTHLSVHRGPEVVSFPLGGC
jgi:2'-5' RNA ligase